MVVKESIRVFQELSLFCMFSSEMLSQGCLIQFGYVTQWALVQYCMVWVDDHSHQLLHAFDS